MAIEKTIVLNVDASKGVGGVKNLNNELGNTSKAVNQTKTDMSGISGVADNVTGGAVSKFSGLTGVIGNVSKGFTTLKGAILASGIGALVVIIASVISAFKASEEGQNKFAKIMGVIGSVVGNVMDVISDLGEIIIGVLSGDSEAIKSATAFGKKIFDVVGLPIKNIISVVQTAANVIKGLWNDGIDGALTALENGVEDVKGNFKDATNAINDGANALKKFGEEALREAKIAQQIADQRAKADKTDRELIVQRAEADRKVAELREQALDREKYNTKQRIGFLNEASRVEQEVTNKEIQSAILRTKRN
jgi:phage-related protein